MHLAAESHNDRAIEGPMDFVRTNVMGTAVLLEAARAHWNALPADAQGAPSASTTSPPTRCSARWARTATSPRTTPYDPNSPYSAEQGGAPTTWCAPGAAPTACRWC